MDEFPIEKKNGYQKSERREKRETAKEKERERERNAQVHINERC